MQTKQNKTHFQLRKISLFLMIIMLLDGTFYSLKNRKMMEKGYTNFKCNYEWPWNTELAYCRINSQRGFRHVSNEVQRNFMKKQRFEGRKVTSRKEGGWARRLNQNDTDVAVPDCLCCFWDWNLIPTKMDVAALAN